MPPIAALLADRVREFRRENRKPFLLALCGWADTGKSTLAASIADELRLRNISADWISTDAFMQNRNTRNQLGISGYNSLSIRGDELRQALQAVSLGQAFDYYPYDNWSGTKAVTPRPVAAQEVIIVEGIHALHPQIIDLLHLKIFIDADEATLRQMRLDANQSKRGMNLTQAGERIDHEFHEF
uniref:uridine kinase family protein n=1 Tax=Chitinimonas sp. TaxID=1934313 RepID=UPI0035B2DDED